MKIKAKFIGTNSLGYENGKEYILDFGIYPNTNRIWILHSRAKECEYNSLYLFLQNWEVLK